MPFAKINGLLCPICENGDWNCDRAVMSRSYAYRVDFRCFGLARVPGKQSKINMFISEERRTQCMSHVDKSCARIVRGATTKSANAISSPAIPAESKGERRERMKIGMVSPYDWSHPGGVREHVRHLADEFTAMGHEVRILAPVSGIENKLSEQNVYTMGKPTPIPIDGSIARIALNSSFRGRVRRILQREGFDVIHLHEPLIPGLPLAVLHFSGSLNVGTFHAYAQSNMTSTPYLAYASAYPFLRPYFNRLDGRIAVSLAP